MLDFEKFGRFEASHMTVDETHLTVQYHVTSLNQSKHSLAVGDGIRLKTANLAAILKSKMATGDQKI